MSARLIGFLSAVAMSGCTAAGAGRSSGMAAVRTPDIVVGDNVQVSAARAGEAHYETHAAAHPTDPARMIVGAIVYAKVGRRGDVVYATTDNGATWKPTLDHPVLENNGDPAVAYGPDGTAYYAGLTLRGHPLEEKPVTPRHNWDGRKTLLYRSADGGQRWDGPATFDFADREYIVVDDTRGRHHGRVYVTGDPRPRRGFEVFSSDDGGRTFPKTGVEADVPGVSIGNAVITSDGTLVGVFADAMHVRAVASIDGGATLQRSIVVDTFVIPGNRKDARHNNVNHFLHMAVDRSGGAHNDRIYVAWPDRRSGHSEVMVSYSDDRGRTWATSRNVTDNPPADTMDQFMPTLAVNNAGVVGLLWYDRRDNPDNTGFYPRFTASLDGGSTWLPSVRASTAPYAAGAVAQKSAFAGNGGDTAGLVATADGLFHPFWVDDRTGIPQVWTAPIKVQSTVNVQPGVRR